MEKIFCGRLNKYVNDCGLCMYDLSTTVGCPYYQAVHVDWCQYHDTEITMQDCIHCPKYDDDGQCDYRG